MPRYRHSPLLTALLLGCGVTCIYLLSGSSDLLHNGDTDLRIQTTQALVDHFRLWIAHPKWLDTRVALGRGHHLYAFYGPGQIVLMVPLYVAGKFLAHHLHLPYDTTTLYAARSLDLFLGGALAALFFLLAVSAGYTRRVAAGLTLVFAFATVAWPDATSGLEQTQVNLFLLLAVLATWKWVNGGTVDRRLIALAGAAIGLAVLTRYDALLYLPLFGLYVLLMHRKKRVAGQLWGAWLALLAGAAPCLAGVGLWNFARFGSPFLTGLHEQTLGNPPLLGLAELLVSPGKGLLWYLPVVFVLPWVVSSFWRRVPDLAILCALLVALPILSYANVRYWHGDPSWGPRYLYVAVPYLVLPLGEIGRLRSRRRQTARVALMLTAGAGLILSLSAISVTQWRFWYRLEALQQQHSNVNTWSGQPFRWGAQHYHYYWTPRESPIVIQIDDVYQVTRLLTGTERYRLQVQPDPYVSNPAVLYPVNTFAPWWADTLHPLLGERTRLALAASMLLAAGFFLTAALLTLRPVSVGREAARAPAVDVQPIGT